MIFYFFQKEMRKIKIRFLQCRCQCRCQCQCRCRGADAEISKSSFLAIFNELYQFTCLSIDYRLTIRVRFSTKLTKVPFSHVRRMGQSSVDYVGDLYLIEGTYKLCHGCHLGIQGLGFIIYPEK